jgi:hypothetical protein
MYQPYPGGAQMPEPSRTPAPPAVIKAVRVMYAGAAVSLIGILINLTTLSSTKDAIRRRSPRLTPDQVNSAEHVAVAGFIIGGIITIALWIFVARSCQAGKNWARIVGTVLFGINTLDLLIGAAAVPSGGVDRIYQILVWLVGLAVIVLLWQRHSSEYFRAAT